MDKIDKEREELRKLIKKLEDRQEKYRQAARRQLRWPAVTLIVAGQAGHRGNGSAGFADT